ncbi:alpha/beta fold hydrolase [Catellatospora sp. KI3]|uniref:thioesterase II family protein n=1 Tax=Catellatospora sp. KI3 TaxID=3041620 RepID=UPI002482293C|nr:alpha/beta fold hydrolase [Catellatospora sp. KI3]MDI1461437.1 alpha/beta fold hydrolase [Catellatospora sp. KI3]
MDTVYCFHHAGGSEFDFVGWPRLSLRPQIVALSLPGHGSRLSEPALFDVGAIANRMADEIDTERPYGLFGHSFGALVAFEVARTLRRRGRPLPERLWLSSFPAPGAFPVLPPISHLSDLQLLVALQDRYGGLPPELFEYDEMIALYAGVLRADFTALEYYRHAPEPPLPCSAVVLDGSVRTVEDWRLAAWARHFEAPPPVFRLTGDHFYLRDQVNAATIVAMLVQAAER